MRNFVQKLVRKIFLPALIPFFLSIFLTACSFFGDSLPEKDLKIETIGGEVELTVEAADSAKERENGLMGRENLDEGRGMWFEFEEPQILRFWMWNMKFPIDIIYVGADFKIQEILPNAPACDTENVRRCTTYPSSQPAQYVLEVPAGYADANGIMPGAKITLD